MRASSFEKTEPRAHRPRGRASNNQAPAIAAAATYNLFFSHKTQDHSVIKSIIKLILKNTENIRCFISEDIEKGTDWRKAIAEALTASSSLVLVFTDPNENWGWCLYETGFFDALTQIGETSQTRRIYCLHNPSTNPPSPIANLQSIPAAPVHVNAWLTRLYNVTHQPQHRIVEIPVVVDEICKLFVVPRKLIYSTKSINVSVNATLLKSPDDLPEDTVVEGEERVLEELFGTQQQKISWTSVKERFHSHPRTSEANLNAIKELSRAVYCIRNYDRVIPVQGTIFVGDGPKRYRPVVDRVEESSAGFIRCEILLVDDVGGQLQNVEKGLAALLTAIRMAVRIRWEIIRPFVPNLDGLALVDPRKLRLDLQTCFNNIFLEAEFRGSYVPADVLTAFNSDIDKTKITTMINEFVDTYAKIWQGLGFTNGVQTFGDVSNQPFSSQDIALLDEGLRQLEKMNKDFLDIALARARVLIDKELGICQEYNGEDPGGGFEGRRVLARWNTYAPYGEFRIRWAQKRYEDRYDAADMQGETTVSSGNQALLRLFKFGGDSVPDPDGADGQTPLTLRRLMDRIRQYSSEEDFAAFDSDQKRVVDEIIMKDGYEQVKVAMKLSYPEDQHRKRTFLPLLVAKRTVGDLKGPHSTYLLVTYAETTADAGSFRPASLEPLSGPAILSIASDNTRSAAD